MTIKTLIAPQLSHQVYRTSSELGRGPDAGVGMDRR